MGIFKAVGFVTLWILLSFVWVSLGQGQVKNCQNYGAAESWMRPHATLDDWYHYFVERNNCEAGFSDFIKVLAASETLSIRANQAGITFEELYVPLYHVLGIENREGLSPEEMREVASNLSSINVSLETALRQLNAADRDYFRAMVLLHAEGDFVEGGATEIPEDTVSQRLNQPYEPAGSERIANEEVAPPPYRPVFFPR